MIHEGSTPLPSANLGGIMIPKSFMLFGTEYVVSRIGLSNEHFGRCDAMACQIDLNSDKLISETVLEQTFWHEVIHAILWRSGNAKLGKDEDFVDLMASCIHQVVTTSIYEEASDASE